MILIYKQNRFFKCLLSLGAILYLSVGLFAKDIKSLDGINQISLVPVVEGSNNITICGNESQLIYAKSSVATDSVFITSIVTGDTLAKGVDSVAVSIDASQTGQFSLIASNNDGVTTKTISIISSNPQAMISGIDSIVSCFDDTIVDINASNSIGGLNFSDVDYKYLWSSDDVNLSFNSDVLENTEVSQLVENRGGSSKVFLEIEDSLGCSSQDSIDIVWDTKTELEIQSELMFFCEGESASTYAFIRSGDKLSNYQWNLITGPADFTIEEDSIITITSGLYAVIEVVAENDLGCIFRDSLIAIEKRLPLDVGISRGLVCIDDIIDLSVDFDSIPNNNYSYNWEINDVKYSTSKDTILQVLDTSSVKIIVTDIAFNCDYEFEDIVNVSVPIAIAGSELLDTVRICEDVFFTNITADSSYEGTPYNDPPYEYLWTTSDPNFSLLNSNSTNVSVENISQSNNLIGRVELQITDRLGCTGKDSVWLEWNNKFRLDVLQDTLLFCIEDADSLKVTDNQLGTFSNYQWNLFSGSSNYSVKDDTTLVVDSAYNAVFTVHATDTYGCPSNTDTVFVNTIDINAEISTLPNLNCVDDLLNLDFVFDSLHTYTYEWYVDDVLYSMAQDTVYEFVNTTEIKVQVIDQLFGCVSKDSTLLYLSQPIAVAGMEDTVLFCNDVFDVSTTVGTSTGGSPFTSGDPYKYFWSTVETNLELTDVSSEEVKIKNINELNIYEGKIKLEIEDRIGCTSTDSILVKWDKQKDVKISKDSLMFCQGDVDSVKATLVGNGNFVNYEWNLIEGSASYTSTDSTLILSSADNAIVEVVAQDANGCIFRDSVFVSNFILDAKIDLIDTIGCVNESINLMVSFDPIVDHIYTTKWIVDNIEYSNAQDTVLAIDGSHKIIVEVTDQTGTCYSKDSVNVYPSIPVAVIGASESHDSISICSSSNQIFVSGSKSFSGTEPYTFSWSTLDNRISLTESTNDTVKVVSSQENITSDLMLTITDDLGCISHDTIVLDWQEKLLANVDFDELTCYNINDTIAVDPNFDNVSVQWSVSSGVSVVGSATNETLIYHPNSLTSDLLFNVSLKNENNCTSDTSFTVKTQKIDLDVDYTSGSTCSSIDIPFVAKATGSSSDLYYYWDGLTRQLNDSLRSFSFTQDSSVVISVLDTNTLCSATNRVDIEINELQISTSIDQDSICYNENLLLELNVLSGGAGGYEIVWSGGELATPQIQTNILVQPTVLGLENQTTYYVKVTDTLGCERIDSVLVSRNNQITSQLTNPTSYVCQYSTISLGDVSGNASGGSNDLGLSWSSSAGTVSPSTGNVVDFTPSFSGNIDVNVKIIDNKIPSCFINDVVVVDVKAEPILTLFSDSTICSSDSIVLDADTTNSTGVTYEWLPNGETTKSIKVLDSTTFTVIATSDFGCVNTDKSNINLSTVTDVTLVGNDSNICITEVKELSVSNTQSGFLTWVINKGDTTIVNDTTIQVYSSQVLESVNVQALYKDACTDTTINVFFDVKSAPFANFSVSEAIIQQSQPFTLIDNSTVGSDVSYTWTVETGLENFVSNDSIGPVVEITETGVFLAHLLIVDNETKCSDDYSTTVEILDGSNRIYIPTAFYSEADNEENRVIKVYGNNISTDDFVLEIFNRWGESVYKTTSLEEAQNIGWDGSVSTNSLNDNVTAFTYVLQGKFIDGSIIDQKGNITTIK